MHWGVFRNDDFFNNIFRNLFLNKPILYLIYPIRKMTYLSQFLVFIWIVVIINNKAKDSNRKNK